MERRGGSEVKGLKACFFFFAGTGGGQELQVG